MRILFVFRSINLISYYRSIVEELCGRGHEVKVFFDKKWSKRDRFGAAEVLAEMKENNARFDYELVESSRGFSRHILSPLREIRNYRRYLIVGGQSDFYRRDWINFLPRRARPFLLKKNSFANRIIKNRVAGFMLGLVENIGPADSQIKTKLTTLKPNAVVVSPANMRHSSADTEYLKAAKALGIPSIVSVMSWDNLTVRGIIPVVPDIVLVWNAAQQEEAMKHHSIPREKIRLIGSPLFDAWFRELKPSISREEFCRENNLKSDWPYILYLGSSKNIAENEVWLIKDLRKALDNSTDQLVRAIQIAVRPHPSNYQIYENIESDGVIIVPKKGMLPATADARQFFYDSLYYSIGTVGINTSGMIDALILDKPGVAIMTDKYRETQLEAVHFQQFLKEGCLLVAKSPEHFRELVENLLEGKDDKMEQRRAFVKNYIRPLGLNVSAGMRAAEEIELIAVGAVKQLNIL